MNSSKFRFTLDLHSIQSQYSIPVMLGDTGVTFLISITDGGVPYIINDGCLAKLSIKRPTGSHLEEFCTIKNNAIVEYPFSQNENTCAVAGIHHCDVTLYGPDGAKLGGPRFTMVVSDKVVSSDDIVLTDEDWTAVDAMLAKEAERQEEERKRANAETERISSEEIRVSTETERVSAEANRTVAETERVSAEAERNTAETERISAEAIRVSNEDLRVLKDAERDAAINNAVNTSGRAESNSANALDNANRAIEDVANIKAEFGSEVIATGQKTVKGAVNYAVSTADAAKNQSDIVRTNLINLSAQVEGIGRSYVVPNFSYFIDFLKSIKSVELREDRDGDGVDEVYNVYISDLKTGDNIIITEKGVPDFWFEKNSAVSTFDAYTYNNKEYTLSATANGTTIGGAHILETDYTVIEGYATSSAASANNARESATNAKNSENEAKVFAEAAALSAIEASVSSEVVQEFVSDKKNIENRINRNDKRIKNLEQGIPSEMFETDSAVAYVKDVPPSALPYAEISKIGGMTRKCTNLIPFPYADGMSKVTNGITFTVNDDGSIQVKGTATANAYFYLSTNIEWNGASVYAMGASSTANGKTYKNCQYYAKNKQLMLNIEAGSTVDKTYFPMINNGETTLPYEPYFEGLRSAPVTEVESVGVNIWDEQWKTGTYNNSPMVMCKNKIPVQPNTKYYFKSPVAPANGIWFYDASLKAIGSAVYPSANSSFTTPDGAYYMEFRMSTTYGETYNNDICISISNAETNGKYFPYVHNTLPIPEAVQALDGYGESNPDNSDEYNYVDWGHKKFIACGHIVDGSWVAFDMVQETDISDILSADNLIEVEGNGRLTFKNEHKYNVPSEATYMLKGVS